MTKPKQTPVTLTEEQAKDVAEAIAQIYIAGYGEAMGEAQGDAGWQMEYRQRAQDAALDLKEYGIILPYPWIYQVPWT